MKRVKKLGFQFVMGLGECFPTIVVSGLKTVNVFQGHFVSFYSTR